MRNGLPLPKPWVWQKRFEIEIDTNNITRAFEIFDGYKRVRYVFEYDNYGVLIRFEKSERVE